ncbi:MAG: TIGR04133 family radical SAM/SPASM protein [Muribaculaceae bacterium]|nr:TIGR04133 family radical SAM/SPASM protein [Muribaculaceae bacterium]
MSAPKAKLGIRRRLALELFRLHQKQKIREHTMRQLFWECTQRCNIACRHCGSDCSASTTIPDFPGDEFVEVCRKLARHVDPHQVTIVITGGEPLVRSDLESVGAQLHALGYPWGIVTNGLALTPERFRRLVEAGLRAITISIDGLEEDHNWMRGNPLSFARATAAIRTVAAVRGINWDVVTCVNRRNIAHLPELKEHLIANGVKGWRLFTVFPAGRAAGDADLALTPVEYRSLMEFIKDTRAESRINAKYCCEGFLGDYEGTVRPGFFQCHAGVSVASVLIDGSIGACPSIRCYMAQGNVRTDDLWEVWQTRYQPYRDRSWMRKDDCKDCRNFRYCRGNGMHLRDAEGRLLRCNLKELQG